MGRKIAAILSAFTLMATGLSWVAWTGINRVEANLKVDDSLAGVLNSPTPAATDEARQTGPLNILLVGSDTRTGQGSEYGSEAVASGNGRSDTTLLLHISGDRRSAFLVSIPRDSWVTRPGCRADGTTDGTQVTGKFNQAFAVGGRRCVIAAVKALTNVPIDHFVEVDFKGFKRIVDALGGVSICSTEAISDPVRPDGNGGYKGSGLEIPKGESKLDGEMALALVRARYIGDGSDITRLDRQHKFLSAAIREASSSGLLTDPGRLYAVLSAIAGSMTVDAGLSGENLRQFLISLDGISPDSVRFYTVPIVPRGDGANVLWGKGANAMWKAMINDTSYPPKKKPAGTASATPSLTPSGSGVEESSKKDCI